jgi:UDP-N-acetylglucosamine 4,6-dehydratase
MFDGKIILVTGGTGSFGRRFIRMTLAKHRPAKIIVFSRDEMKQHEMAQEFRDEPRLRFFLGDVRDKDRLARACHGVDMIVHAAALKIVPTAEYNPFEFIKTNIMGAMNLIDCAIDKGVKRVVALSTDKACSPVNLYGATKLCADKLFVSGNYYAGVSPTRFSVVRYGNVMGSRGSIIPRLLELASTGEIPITHKDMSRFMITLEQAVELVWTALSDSCGGEIYVPKIPSMNLVDIVKTIAPQAKHKVIGIRAGEKLHEQMINIEEARNCYEYDGYFKIFPQIDFQQSLSTTQLVTKDGELGVGRKVPEDFCYSSDTNTQWMSTIELGEWISREYEWFDLPDSEVTLPAALEVTVST